MAQLVVGLLHRREEEVILRLQRLKCRVVVTTAA